jgi:hypothetical protein
VNYGDLKTSFVSILNRRDVTVTQISTFMEMGTRMIQRSLRVPSMEKLFNYTSDGSGVVPVPTDLLEVISISMNDPNYSYRLIRSDIQTVLSNQLTSDYPKYYYRSGAGFLIGPKANSGLMIHVIYHGEFDPLISDSSVNWLTTAAPDLLIYAALGYASDYFLDDRKTAFEQRYLYILQELQNQASQDELSNASISPKGYDGQYSRYPGSPY